jgi:hypothetical protein
MKSKSIAFVGILLFASALTRAALAETRQLSWNAVTTYTDGTSIEPGKTVKYTVCWTNDPWVAADTLRTLVSSTTATSTTFDPAAEEMIDYQRIYFSVKTVLSTGEESALSAALPYDPLTAPADPPPDPPTEPSGKPIAPANLGITRASNTPSLMTWQIFWDPVTKYSNGVTIEGETVQYTLYWTTDAGLSLASLTPLASSITETSFTFDPAAAGMTKNQRVFFAAKTVLGTREESALSAALSWRVSNKGPGAPGNGRMIGRNK